MRALAFAPLAALLSAGLFVLMAQLAGIGQVRSVAKSTDLPLVMHRLRLDAELQLRQRQRPPEPEQPPPAPEMPAEIMPPTPALESPSVDLPSFDRGLAVRQATPSLARFEPVAAPAMAQTGLQINLHARPSVRINPTYPRRALRRRQEGFVQVQFQVGSDGRVLKDSFKVLQSEPPKVFDKAVRSAILRWQFSPAPQPYLTRQRIEFALED